MLRLRAMRPYANDEDVAEVVQALPDGYGVRARLNIAQLLNGVMQFGNLASASRLVLGQGVDRHLADAAGPLRHHLFVSEFYIYNSLAQFASKCVVVRLTRLGHTCGTRVARVADCGGLGHRRGRLVLLDVDHGRVLLRGRTVTHGC